MRHQRNAPHLRLICGGNENTPDLEKQAVTEIREVAARWATQLPDTSHVRTALVALDQSAARVR